MAVSNKRVLIIEDDSIVASALYRGLHPTYTADIALRAACGLRKIQQTAYAAVLLDLHMPDIPGLVVCQKIRELNSKLAIIIITGDTDLKRKLHLFEAGADDYIIKPFSVEEIRARLRVAIRHNQSDSPVQIRCGDLLLDPDSRQVERAGQLISLRRKEFALLECLMLHVGTVVTRAQLIDYAWDGDHTIWANSIDVHIKYLRDKVDRPFPTQLIQTIHGIGYRLHKLPT